jgi:hypothetical protein
MAPRLVPVDHDPFADAPKPSRLSPVDYDPFATVPQSGPIEAVGDIGRSFIKGVAGGKEATPEDAADRANAIQQVIGRKVLRGRGVEQRPVSPEQYRPFFQEQQQEMKAAGDRAGWAGTVAEFGGMVAGAGKIGKAVEMGQGAVKAAPVIGAALASPWAGAAATGGILGVSGAQGTDQNKLIAALLGSGAGLAGQAAGNAIAGGVSKAAGAFNAKPNIPSPENLGGMKRAAYQEAENAGVVYSPEFFQTVQQKVVPTLTRLGFDKDLQTTVTPVLRRLEQAGQQNHTLEGVDILRQVAAGAYKPGDKKTNSMVRAIIGAIDDTQSNPGAAVIMGDAATGSAAITRARELAAREFKAAEVQRKLDMARNQADSANSGQNIQNATRQRLKDLLNRPDKTRGFSPDEMDALRSSVRGTPAQNTLRWAGNAIPSQGIGAIMSGGAGAMALGPVGAIGLPLVGMGLKKSSDKLAERNVEKLLEIIRAGGSRAATLPKENAVQRLAKTERDRLARLLMMGGITAGAPLTQ